MTSTVQREADTASTQPAIAVGRALEVLDGFIDRDLVETAIVWG